MVCDFGCRTPLANLVPDRVKVLPDAATARSVRELEETNARLRALIDRADRASRRAFRRLDRRFTSERISATQEIERLKDQIAALAAKPDPATPWGAYAGWFLAGSALSALGFGVIRKRASTKTEPLEIKVPDDVSELIESR
jgi:hypothetical protein